MMGSLVQTITDHWTMGTLETHGLQTGNREIYHHKEHPHKKKVQDSLGICPNMDGASIQLPKLLIIKIAHKSPRKRTIFHKIRQICLTRGS